MITALLSAVSSTQNPLETGGNLTVLDRRLAAITRNPPPSGSLLGGSVSGSFRSGNATVHLPNQSNSTPPKQVIQDVKDVVNEILHLAGRKVYSDPDFVDVVRGNSTWANATARDNVDKTPQVFFEDDPSLTPAEKALASRNNSNFSS
jgi:hypothetical protein